MMMSEVDEYLQAADRENTVRSYASGVRHFEEEWKGLLPATSESIARYLAAYAPQHAISTLRQRLAALARWHADQGFADPTRSPMVRKVLRGIRAKHTSAQRQARPLEIEQLRRVSDWLEKAQGRAREQKQDTQLLRLTRDRSLLLLGFWRAFRSDELVRMQIEDVQAIPGQGMTCRLPRSKTDRGLNGRSFQCPALSQLCPVGAYSDWVQLSGRTSGPVFPRIDRWGNLSETPMYATNVIPLLRRLFHEAGLEAAAEYSSHSLRRGFAGWARTSGWDLKDMMAYVGWRDVSSALRYVDAPDALQQRFERGLAASVSAPAPAPAQPLAVMLPTPTHVALLELKLHLTRPGGSTKGTERALRLIEKVHLDRFAPRRTDRTGRRFALEVPFQTRDSLDETALDLLDEIYRAATDNGCLLEASLSEVATGTHWD